MDGMTVASSGIVATSLGSDWHIAGVGDFNNDHRSDILWQRNDGEATIWLMNSSQIMWSNLIQGTPTNYLIKGAQDINGDGKADIIWEDTAGTTAVWFMDGVMPISSSSIGPKIGSSWRLIAGG